MGRKITHRTAPAKGKKASPHQIRLRVGNDDNQVDLDADDLSQAALDDLADQVGRGSKRTVPLTLTAKLAKDWPPEARAGLWNLWTTLRGARPGPVAVRIEGKKYPSPVDLALAGLLDLTAEPEQKCRALDLAAEVLVGCYPPEERGVHLEALLDQVRQQGLTVKRCEELKAHLKQRLKAAGAHAAGAGGSGAGLGEVTAFDLARLFLEQQYRLARQRDEAPDAGDEDSDDETQAESGRTAYALRYYDETFYRRRPGVWVKTSVEELRLELTTFLQQVAPARASAKFIGDVLVNVKALCALLVDGTPPLPFYVGKPRRHLLALQNGLLDLDALADGEEPELLPHNPDWFSTTILPFGFDPKAKCPRFSAFLGQVLNADPETLKPKTKRDKRVKVVQEMLGYSFLTDNRFQKFFVLRGEGWNGKGTLFHVWQHLIGAENVGSVTLEGMGKEFGTESLVGKLLNLSGDMNEIDNAKEGTLKTWTGEDLVTVYRKYKPPLEVEPRLKFAFSCNTLPWFRDKTNGIWRRMEVIPFTFALQSADEADPALRPKLRRELPGILNWALRGLARLLEQGHFTHCAVCAAAAEEHREECSPVRAFILNHFAFASEHKGAKDGLVWKTTTKDVLRMVKKYQEECNDRSLNGHIVCRVLAGMPGVTARRPTTVAERTESGGNVYYGVCIGTPKNVWPGEADEQAEPPVVKLPRSFVLDSEEVVIGPNGKPVTHQRSQRKRIKKSKKKSKAA